MVTTFLTHLLRIERPIISSVCMCATYGLGDLCSLRLFSISDISFTAPSAKKLIHIFCSFVGSRVVGYYCASPTDFLLATWHNLSHIFRVVLLLFLGFYHLGLIDDRF